MYGTRAACGSPSVQFGPRLGGKMSTLRRAIFVVIPLLLAACGADLGDPTGSQGAALDQVNSTVIINEVLANEPGSDTTREFVELVNTGTGAVDLSKWTVSDATSVRHTFASGTSLGAGKAIVVFGSSAGIPAGLTNAVGASTGSLGLGNSGDSVVIKDATGAVMGNLTYASSLGSQDGVSMNRSPDGVASGAFVLHNTLSSKASSPGTRVDGSAFNGTGTDAGTDAGTDGGTTDAGTTDGGVVSGKVFLNEVLANEPGSTTSEEFVEVVNGTSSAQDLSGWTLTVGTTVKHTFANGTVVPAGGAIVVFGGASGIPSGLNNAVAASSGSLGLSNSGSSVTLKSAGGVSQDSVTYGSALASQDGVSMNRSPDGVATGSWVLHNTISMLSSSPGVRANGSSWTSGGTDGGVVDGGTDGGVDGGTTDGGTTDAGTADAGTGSDGGSVHLRLMAGNLSSGNYQSWDDPAADGCAKSGYAQGEGKRLIESMKPDVVMIQEMNYFGCDGLNSPADVAGFVNAMSASVGFTYNYYRETMSSGIQIPNGILSRYPIIAAGEWADSSVGNRMYTWAEIQIPGSHHLWAISVHLLTSSSTNRNTEATQLVSLIRQNIPAGDYLVLGGDFNTQSRTEAAVTTFGQVFDVAAPYPVDQNGNENTNSSRAHPEDWVLVTPNLRAYQTPTAIGSHSFNAGLVLDTRVYSPLSEISPALSGDSASSNMQHMGVVKDFVVPGT
jgi:endonuclease/exonuclease/phosphatase family metal-dependent hydrolase